MGFGDRLAKAQRLSGDLEYQKQANEAIVKRNISRKPKREATYYSTSFSQPLLDQPIPFDPEEFFTFCNEDLGFTLEEKPHRELCAEIASLFPDLRFPVNQPKRFGLILLPRSSFKTSVCSIALPLFILTKNPNARIMISAHRHDVAKERLSSIKRYIERDATFIGKYGNWKPEFKEEKWSEDSIVITTRTQNLNDPTIDTCAVDRNKDGSHPDVVIGDDIQSVTNAATPVMRLKVQRHVNSMSPQLQPGGTMLIIGTRKHNQDIYGKIYKLNDDLVARGKPPMYSTLTRGAYLEDGSLYFPGRLDHETLEGEKLRLGPKEFANEYLNEPIEDGAKMFTKDKFASMEAIEHFVDPYTGGGLLHVKSGQIPVNVGMVWDPAGHKPSESSDYHGVTVVGYDPEDHWWVLKAEQLKGAPDYVLSRVAGLIVRYRPNIIGIETVFRQEMWVFALRQHLTNMGVDCPAIREIESKEAKYGRISALQPMVQSDRITLDVTCTALREQLLDYPEVEHDDLVDSLASHIVIARPSQPDDVPFLDEDDYFEDLHRPVDRRAAMGAYAGLHSSGARI